MKTLFTKSAPILKSCLLLALVLLFANSKSQAQAGFGGITYLHGTVQHMSVCAGDTAINIDSMLQVNGGSTGDTDIWYASVHPRGTLVASYRMVSAHAYNVPLGMSYTPPHGYSGNDTFVVVVYDLSGDRDTTTVYVNISSAYVSAISGPDSVCQLAHITFTDSATGGTWHSRATSIVAVDSSTGVVVGRMAGATTTIYYVKDAGVCGSDTAYKTITVKDLPLASSITLTRDSVCVGSTITFSDVDTGGVWMTSYPSTATISSSGVAYGIAAGANNAMYIVSNSCGSDTTRTGFQVLPLPNSGTISGTDSVCPGTTVTLSVGGASGGGIWYSTNMSMATVSASGVVSGVAAGIDSIKFVVSNYCGSDTSAYRVVVRSHASCTTEAENLMALTQTFGVYPNPNNGSFDIQLPAGLNGSSEISITNLIGQTVEHVTINSSNSASITPVTLHVPAGTYFIRANTPSGIYSTRINIQ